MRMKLCRVLSDARTHIFETAGQARSFFGEQVALLCRTVT